MPQRYAPASVTVGEDIFRNGNRFSINVFRLGYPIATGVLRSQKENVVVLEFDSSELSHSEIVLGKNIYLGYGCSTQRMLFQIEVLTLCVAADAFDLHQLGLERLFGRCDSERLLNVGAEKLS